MVHTHGIYIDSWYWQHPWYWLRLMVYNLYSWIRHAQECRVLPVCVFCCCWKAGYPLLNYTVCLQFVYCLVNLVTDWSFFSYSSKQLHSQTIRASKLKFWEKVHLPPPVTCHVSHIMFHVSCVTCHMSRVKCHNFKPWNTETVYPNNTQIGTYQKSESFEDISP